MTETAPILSGLGLRLAGGVASPAQAWQVLDTGGCTVGQVTPTFFDPALWHDPAPGRRGKAITFAAGQIADLDRFDPGFFGISPREAAQMDPQQRLMLSLSWEAIEDAGLNVAALRGPRTGVFVGASLVENLTPYYFDTARGGSAFSLGNALSIIANRVSSSFGFGGPSFVIDTACSSGLYALHHAVQALTREEIDTALVGAVHVIRAPGGFVGFSQARMLSPGGLCRAFDAAADGYVRAEAAVMVVLQRPEVAARMLARPRARVLATGINSDGDTSPIMVPSARAQQALIETVLARAGRDPEAFSFYEAHGTGTPVGDPAEAASIGRGLAQLRRNALPIGSAKTNFGHAEPASGLVGLAKLLLAFAHRRLPASLHCPTPNPAIDFDALNLRVARTPLALSETGPLLAGLNSFGFGGTNAVAMLETPPVPSRTAPPTTRRPLAHRGDGDDGAGGRQWLLLSAGSEPALTRLAAAWSAHLRASAATDWPGLAAAVAAARTALPHRLALPLDATAPETLAAGLAAPGLITAKAPVPPPSTVFAFGGNGAQSPGMGRHRFRTDPVWRHQFDACARAFADHDVPGLADLLFAPDLATRLASPLVAQPLLVSCMIASATALQVAGVEPDAVIGHSVGEIAALHLAGAFDLAALARIVASRSRAFEGLRGTGGMATVAATEDEVGRALSGLDAPELVIAAVNAPRSVTISGPGSEIERFGRLTLAGRRVAMVRLELDLPYHSPAIAPLRDRFMADLVGLTFAPLRLAVAGAAVGRMLRPTEVGAEYLWANARHPVQFSKALQALGAEGAALVAELSPRCVLAGPVRDLARAEAAALDHAPGFETETETGPAAAARLWCRGAALRPEALAGARTGPAPPLPPTPRDEVVCATALSPDGLDGWGEAGRRGLAGLRADRAGATWGADFTATAPAWVGAHVLGDTPVLPAAALAEIALAAGAELWPGRTLELRDFDILTAAAVDGDGLRLRTVIEPDTGVVRLAIRPRLVETDWTPLARGSLHGVAEAAPPPHAPPTPRGQEIDIAQLYAGLAGRGLRFGPPFQRLAGAVALRTGGMRLRLAPSLLDGRFTLDPSTLDAALHGLGGMIAARSALPPALAEALAEGAALIPVRIGRLRLWQPGVAAEGARLAPAQVFARSARLDLVLLAADGTEVAQIEAVEFVPAGLEAGLGAGHRPPRRWHSRTVRLRPPGAAVVLPAGWRDASKALEKLGLGPAPPGAPAPTPAPTPAETHFAALRAALARGDSPQPALAALLAQAPDLIPDALVLMARQRGAAPDAAAQASTMARAQWALALRLIAALAGGWRAEARLALVCQGLPDAQTARRLLALARDGLRLFHPDPAGRALLRQTLPVDLAPLVCDSLPAAGADLLLAVGPDGVADPGGLACGGLAVQIDVPALDPGPPAADARFDTSAALPIRVRARRAPAADTPAPSPVPSPVLPAVTLTLPEGATLPDVLRGLLRPEPPREAGAKAGAPPVPVPVAVHLHHPGDAVEAALAGLVRGLRHGLNRNTLPACMIVVETAPDPGFAPLCAGLVAALRSLHNETPDRPVRLLTLEATVTAADWPGLWALLQTEPALHLRGVQCLADRLMPFAPPEPGAEAMALAGAVSGRLDNLRWRPVRRRRPGAGEVEIAVEAVGLNFRDAMLARGLLPERLIAGGASGGGLGMELAGRVLRAGAETPFAPNDAVFGFAGGAFASHLTLRADTLLPRPAGLDAATAAALPVAFLTAQEALLSAAHLAPGESVLVHGGAGGLGLAAIQIARRAGARVFATAASPERRALACAMGAEAAFASRDLSFVAGLRAATGGRGVDVVLNTLAGAAMAATLECLAPFGRFVELGKRDFAEATRISLAPFAQGQSYIGFDLDQRLAARPAALRAGFAALAAEFGSGALTALPVTRFDAADTGAAMAQMLAARHPGKIVIRPPTPSRSPRRGRVRDDWVILGGTGGIGLALARWLLAQGAARVHLLSRTGTPTPGGPADLAAWAEAETRLHRHAVDGADARALEAVWTRIETGEDATGEDATGGRRIDGVIHAAMVLRDRLIRDLDPVETAEVLRAKLGVGVALDRVLRGRAAQPAHVIAFGSLAAAIGNPGQAVYGAANAALGALMAARRAEGLAGRMLDFGPVGDGGVLARNAALAARLRGLGGVGMLRLAQVLAELDAALADPGGADHGLAALDWDGLAAALPALTTPPFAALLSAAATRPRPAADLAADLRALPWAAALGRAEAEVRAIVAAILRLAPEAVDLRRPLGRYGFDSLMAMELRLEVERRFGLSVPVLGLSGETTAARLAVQLLGRLRGETE